MSAKNPDSILAASAMRARCDNDFTQGHLSARCPDAEAAHRLESGETAVYPVAAVEALAAAAQAFDDLLDRDHPEDDVAVAIADLLEALAAWRQAVPA